MIPVPDVDMRLTVGARVPTLADRMTNGSAFGRRSPSVAAPLVVAAILATIATPAMSFAAGTAGADLNGIAPGTGFTPLAGSVLTDPSPVEGSDGVFHLAYELLLTNTTPRSIEIETLEVSDERNGRVLLSLTDAALARVLTRLVAGDSAPSDTTIAGAAVGIVWLDVHVGSRAQAPRVLTHRVVARAAGGPTFDGVVARVPTGRRQPVVLGPPVRPGLWYASEGCCSDVTHHRRGLVPVDGELLVPQRFAIDWFLLDDQQRTWVGDPSQLTSYLSYGQRVIAAADGVVVEARDGLPDQHPPEPPPIPPIQDTLGNHVTIRMRPGMFLLYGHLQPGSVRVRRGRRVRRGQVLGLIGTSGNSTTPHLHFQVITTRTFFPTDSPPFRFTRFDLVGRVTERIWDDNLGLQPTGLLPVGPVPEPGLRRRTMPLDRDVIRFRSR